MEQEQTFFDFAAEVGLTKHLGGLDATDELVVLCHIDKDSTVLDVGCGAGQTPCYLAKKVGCRVVGIDILPAMIQRSKERAARERLTGQVEFKVADAQELPFEDGLFDAVITESVTAFPKDKARAMREYTRVTRPGGYIGLNESTWLKTPPPPEMVAWVAQDIGATVEPLTAAEWRELLEGAGLTDIVERIRPVEVQNEVRGLVRRYGLGGMLRIYGRIFRLYLRNQAYRQFLKGVRQVGMRPPGMDEYFGYGLFVGRK